MTAYSLRARLLALWVLLLASAATTAYLMLGVYNQSTGVQVAQVDVAVGRACREIIDRYAALVRVRGGGIPEGDLGGVVEAALGGSTGVEGGIWSAADGSVAYAYPTYEGTGPKTDLPAAEHDTIAGANAQVLRVDHAVSIRRPSRTQVLLIQSCPLHGPEPGLTAWTMGRARVNDGPTYTRFLAGLGFLAVTVLGSAAFLGWFLYGFSGRIARIEAALRRRGRTGRICPGSSAPASASSTAWSTHSTPRAVASGMPGRGSWRPSAWRRSAGSRPASRTRSATRSPPCG